VGDALRIRFCRFRIQLRAGEVNPWSRSFLPRCQPQRRVLVEIDRSGGADAGHPLAR
jgi:hypothetical protein